ncbi:MAG: flavodoxin family protein [Spirochaetia bacterium]
MSIQNMLPKMTSDYKVRNSVLGISGSPRKGGNSDTLLQAVLKGAEEGGSDTNTALLRDLSISPCIGCERCRKDKICTGLIDGMTSVYPLIISSKALVLVSPTHHYNITAWMKAFIDRLYCFYDFETPRPGPWSSRLDGQNRKAVIVGICEQENEEDMGFTMDAMAKPLIDLGYNITARFPVFSTFTKAGVNKNSAILRKAHEIGRSLSEQIRA